MPQDITLSSKKDNIERSLPFSLMVAEKFPEVAFDTIAIGGLPNLFLDHYPQAVKTQRVPLKKEDEMFRLNSLPPFHDLSELQGMANPLPFRKLQPPFHLNGQPLPPLCSPSFQNFAATLCAHPFEKSVSPFTSEAAGLIGLFHFPLSFSAAFILKSLNFLFKPHFFPIVKLGPNSC